MNKTYKVARSLTRGTVVTSEAASSRQGKALKMVVAAMAATFVGGVAMAEGTPKNIVIESDQNVSAGAELKDGDSLTVNKNVTVKVTGEGLTFEVNGGTVTNNGTMKGNGSTVTITKGTVTNNGLLDFGNGNVTIGGGTEKAELISGFTAADVKLVNDKGEGGVLTLAEKGVVNMTALNSEFGLLLAGSTFNFNGGELQLNGEEYAGDVKVGGNGTDYAKLTTVLNINANYKLGALSIQNGTVNVGNEEKNASLEVQTLTVGGKNAEHELNIKSGSQVAVKGDTVTIDGTVKNEGLLNFGKATVTINKGGVLESKFLVPVENATEGAVFAGELNLKEGGKLIVTGNSLALVGATFNLSGDIKTSGGSANYEKAVGIGNATVNINNSYKVSDLTVTNAEVNVATGKTLTTTGKVTIENGTLTNSGTLALGGDVTIENGGVLNTKFTKDDVTQSLVTNTLTLNAGGVLNLLAVNAEKSVQLGGATYKFAGGKLQVAGEDYSGALTVGATNEEKASLTISKGSYAFGDVTVAKLSTLTVSDTGSLTINGTLTAEEDALKISAGGGLTTSAKNLFDGEGKTLNVAESSGMVNATGGTITVTDELSLKLEDIKKAADAYGSANLMFDKVTVLANDESGKVLDSVAFKDAVAVKTALINQTAALEDAPDKNGKVTGDIGTKTVGFAALAVHKDTTEVEITGDTGTLILSGAKGNVVTTDQVTALSVAGNLQLGKDANSSGTVNVNRLTVGGTLDVVGDFTAQNYVGVTGELTVDGKLLAKQVSIGADSKVAGEMDVESIVGNDNANQLTVDGALSAKKIQANVDVNGTLVIGERMAEQTQSRAIRLASSDAEKLAPQIQSTVTVAAGAVASTNANGKALAVAALGDITNKAVLYVDSTIALSEDGKLLVGTGAASADGGVVAVASNGALVVDMASFAANSVVFEASKLDIKSGATFNLTNLTSEKTVTLVSGGEVTHDNGVEVTGTHALLTGKIKEGTLTVAFNDEVAAGDDETKAALKSALAEGANAKTQAVIAAVADTSSTGAGLANKDGLKADGVRALEEYLTAPVTAGVYNVAYDATAQVNATVARRNVENTTGTGVWADVFYTANKAKKAYGDHGYSADISGGMLGVDTVFANGFKVGGAFTVGTSDADSEKSFSKFSTDTDFYGVSLYAGSHVGDTSLYLSADASYLWADNDIKGSVAGVSASESLDSKVFTAGVRADWNVYESNVLTVAPHVGVRYTSIDVDDYRGLNSDSMNIVEMPIGIKVAGNFEAAVFKLTPAFDFTVVPEVGDKKVSTAIGDVDVINNLYNASLGVQAEMGNFTFGVNYKCGFGQDDRSNNSFNANVRYTF